MIGALLVTVIDHCLAHCRHCKYGGQRPSRVFRFIWMESGGKSHVVSKNKIRSSARGHHGTTTVTDGKKTRADNLRANEGVAGAK